VTGRTEGAGKGEKGGAKDLNCQRTWLDLAALRPIDLEINFKLKYCILHLKDHVPLYIK